MPRQTRSVRYRDILRYIYRFTDYERKGLAAYAPETTTWTGCSSSCRSCTNRISTSGLCTWLATKGKGSTAAMIESVLRAAGYRTALYSSPHLQPFVSEFRCQAN